MTSQTLKFLKPRLILDWLDILAITAWGVLLLQYWLTGKLGLLIHPRYFGLTTVTGFVLLIKVSEGVAPSTALQNGT